MRPPQRTPPDRRVYEVKAPFSSISNDWQVVEINPYGRGGSVLRRSCTSAKAAAEALASLKERDRKEREHCPTST